MESFIAGLCSATTLTRVLTFMLAFNLLEPKER